MAGEDFIRALYGEPHGSIPVWYMRQAGRHLKTIAELLKRPIFETVKRPELAARVSLAPLAEIGVDAAIVFADITTPFEAAGLRFELRPGHGPYPLFRPEEAVEALEGFDPFQMTYIRDQIRELKGRAPVIGFVGGPFTSLTYLLGDATRDRQATKAALLSGSASELLKRAEEVIEGYARAQAEWGADAVQVFESWLGLLDQGLYEGYIAGPLGRVLAAPRVPTVLFCRWCGGLLRLLPAQRISFFNPDWSVPLSLAGEALKGVGLQGNLDPAYPLVGGEAMLRAADRVISQVPDLQRYVFNLGHGVYPETRTEELRALTAHVKSIRL